MPGILFIMNEGFFWIVRVYWLRTKATVVVPFTVGMGHQGLNDKDVKKVFNGFTTDPL